jgi:hypothetical protein
VIVDTSSIILSRGVQRDEHRAFKVHPGGSVFSFASISWTLAIQSVAAFSLAKPSIASVWPPQIISTTQLKPVLLFRFEKRAAQGIQQIFASAVQACTIGDGALRSAANFPLLAPRALRQTGLFFGLTGDTICQPMWVVLGFKLASGYLRTKSPDIPK